MEIKIESTKNYPNISVIIPTYNGAKTIKKVLESILIQKYDEILKSL
jgi:glycosyltransferase involved in cell wall biosynthesis